MKTIHVWPQERVSADGMVTLSARLEDEEPFTLWYRTPIEHAELLTARAESFVAAVILLAMRRGATLRVHAPLSPSFLRNLEEFQVVWSSWYPEFCPISIEADSETESTAQAPDRAIATFSGGVDSCYTMWRHTQKRCARRALPLQTALMLHGSEIEIGWQGIFDRALQRTRNMLSSLDVRLVTVASNFREAVPTIGFDYGTLWFGTFIISALLLFQESHTTGLIPASFSYHGLVLPYPSTPLTDPLFSTARFPVEHDGADKTRAGKMREILQMPGVLENLRVCNQPTLERLNCGRCQKCIRNILTLRIAGVEEPPCFPGGLANRDIEGLRLHGTDLEAMRRVVKAARAAGVGEGWLPSVEKCIAHSQRNALLAGVWKASKPLRQKMPSGMRRAEEAIKHQVARWIG